MPRHRETLTRGSRVQTADQTMYQTGANTLIFIIPAEIFPTCYRCTCHGISAAAGKLGSMIAVLVVYGINETWQSETRQWLIFILFFVFMAVGAFCSWAYLPDVQRRVAAEDDPTTTTGRGRGRPAAAAAGSRPRPWRSWAKGGSGRGATGRPSRYVTRWRGSRGGSGACCVRGAVMTCDSRNLAGLDDR